MRNIYLITILVYLFVSSNFPVANALTTGSKTEVTAIIEAYSYLRLFGYTSPNSIVQLIGTRSFGQIESDRNGYFLLEGIPIAKQATEICLSSIDSERRVSFPICINIPKSKRPKEIGPILLAPTLSLSKGFVYINNAAYARGRTIPNQTVEISLFDQSIRSNTSSIKNSLLNRLPQLKAFASDLPILTTKADTRGNFSFSLPTARSTDYRVFAKTYYNNAPTSKSQTLFFSIGTVYLRFIQLYLFKTIIILVLLASFIGVYIYDKKTGKVSLWIGQIIEKKLLPSVARSRLKLRRLRYNFQDWLRTNRK